MIELKNKTPRILVIGDLMIDHYLWGKCERISPEAPVQIVAVEKETSVLGGAGNVVHNLSALGAGIDVLSVIGNDSNADELKSLMHEMGIRDDFLIVQDHRSTSKKSRIIASQQQVVRYDQESTEDISHEAQDKIFEIFKKQISHYDIVLLSDYGKGVLTTALTKRLIGFANEHGKKYWLTQRVMTIPNTAERTF